MKLNVELKEHWTNIISKEDAIEIKIYDGTKPPVVNHSGIGILLFKGKVKNIFQVEKELKVKGDRWDRLILISIPANLKLHHVLQGFIHEAIKNKVTLPKHLKKEKLPPAVQELVDRFVQQQLFIINRFGSDHVLISEKSKLGGKPSHRWNKMVSQIPFYVDTKECQAEIQWVKRNEMVIRAGAVMKREVPLNKNGSIGFAAKMGQKIREDHQQSFKDFKTTEDIILKSVNEVGVFLYFAGTNSWLVLKDAKGQTIDAWTRVN